MPVVNNSGVQHASGGRRMDDDHTTLAVVNNNVLHLGEDILALMGKLEGYMNKNDRDVKQIENRVSAMEPWVKGFKWAVGVIVTIVVAVVIAVLTGQIQLIIK